MSAGGWPSVTSGAAYPVQTETGTNKVNYFSTSFAQSGQNYQEFGIVMPSDYDGGTVTAIFEWTTTSSSTNSVVWQIAGLSYPDNTAIDTVYGSNATVTDANNAANVVNKTGATGACTLGGTPAASQFTQFRIGRNGGSGSDNLAATALLLGVIITYTRT